MKIGDSVFVFFRLPKCPKVAKTIPALQLQNIVKKGNSFCSVYLSDDRVHLFHDQEMIELLKLNYFAQKKYQSEVFDCDDYSISLLSLMRNIAPGFAFGMCWIKMPDGSRHSLNFYINENQKMVFVEPQTNKTFINSNWKPYFILI